MPRPYRPGDKTLLNGEEKARLLELREHEGFKVLLKAIDLLAQGQEREANAVRIEAGKEADVLYAKCRAEGARKLQAQLAQFLSRKPSKK